jgi:hypothetical protein
MHEIRNHPRSPARGHNAGGQRRCDCPDRIEYRWNPDAHPLDAGRCRYTFLLRHDLNLAPLDFGRLIGAYVATFFVVAQIINLLVFRTPPSLPIIVGGLFILTGGAIIALWQR